MNPPTDGEPLTVAFLGCGAAAQMHSRTMAAHFPAVRRFYASRDPAKARSFDRRLGGSGWFTSYHGALGDDRVHAVLITTPPALHLEQTLAALSSGKYPIVEKPAFLGPGDVDRVESAMRASGLHVFVAENYFYKPLARALRSLISSGEVGDLVAVHVDARKSQRARGWRADPGVAGGGPLFEGGVHWINLLAHLGPEVLSASGVDLGDGDDLVTLHYEGGAVATLHHSWNASVLPLGPLRLSRLHGSRGRAVFESNGLFLWVSVPEPRLLLPGFGDLRGYRAMFHDFIQAIRLGTAPLFGLEAARRDLEILAEIDGSPPNVAELREGRTS